MAKSGWKENGTVTSRWRSRLALAAALGAGAHLAAVLAQETPVIRVQVNLVRVIATVKDTAGKLVGALQRDDFEVYDNGVKQEIAVFERQTEQPLSIALLIDISGSTNKDLKYETDSATRFLRALLGEGNPRDAVSLFSFNSDVTQLTGYTHNVALVERFFKTLHGEGGTALYDAIYLVSENLEDRQGRKVIVVVTDGGDTFSAKNDKAALAAAQLADAVIYPVVVVPITNDAGRNTGGEHVLAFMAERTGGRTFLPTLGAQLDKAFADIISELRTQYLIGFYPHNTPLTKDPFHRLQVQVHSPELQVSARNGYYGEAEGGAAEPDARVSVTPDKTITVAPDRKKKQLNQ